jgi:hypothetical protein
MDEVVFVEERLPITVGRGYANDVIMDDRYVCPEHFRVSLDEQGQLVAEDLGSVNGIHLGNSDQRLLRISLGPEAVVKAGHSSLRFRRADYIPPPAEAERAGWRSFFRPFNNPYLALLLCLLSLGSLLLEEYLSNFRGYEVSNLLNDLTGMSLVMLIWSGIWSISNRIVSHSFRFLQHLAFIFAMVAGITIYTNISNYVDFIFIYPDFVLKVVMASFGLWGAIIIFGHLSLLTRRRPVRSAVISMLISFLIVGGVAVSDYLDNTEFSNRLDYSARLRPLSSQWLSTETVEAFFDDMDELKVEVDAIAADLREKGEAEKKNAEEINEESTSE